MIALLIEAGADKDAQDDNGFTALIHAVFTGKLAATEALLYGGVSQTLRTYPLLEPDLDAEKDLGPEWVCLLTLGTRETARDVACKIRDDDEIDVARRMRHDAIVTALDTRVRQEEEIVRLQAHIRGTQTRRSRSKSKSTKFRLTIGGGEAH